MLKQALQHVGSISGLTDNMRELLTGGKEAIGSLRVALHNPAETARLMRTMTGARYAMAVVFAAAGMAELASSLGCGDSGSEAPAGSLADLGDISGADAHDAGGGDAAGTDQEGLPELPDDENTAPVDDGTDTTADTAEPTPEAAESDEGITEPTPDAAEGEDEGTPEPETTPTTDPATDAADPGKDPAPDAEPKPDAADTKKDEAEGAAEGEEVEVAPEDVMAEEENGGEPTEEVFVADADVVQEADDAAEVEEEAKTGGGAVAVSSCEDQSEGTVCSPPDYGTGKVGICTDEEKCEGETGPEVCDEKDNNGDGKIDNVPGAGESCENEAYEGNQNGTFCGPPPYEWTCTPTGNLECISTGGSTPTEFCNEGAWNGVGTGLNESCNPKGPDVGASGDACDADGDTYANAVDTCAQGVGTIYPGSNCPPKPGVHEVCDGLDNDGDGNTDEPEDNGHPCYKLKLWE